MPNPIHSLLVDRSGLNAPNHDARVVPPAPIRDADMAHLDVDVDSPPPSTPQQPKQPPSSNPPFFVRLLTPSLRLGVAGILLLYTLGAASVLSFMLTTTRWTLPDMYLTLELILRIATQTLILSRIMLAWTPNPHLAIPPSIRVAMIATKVPSEPLQLLKTQLQACLNQDVYPLKYDVWLADEDPDQETKAWCASKGIRISCRKGVAAYHQPVWPRRAKCKEGNLSYFYDLVGYDNYDVVCQFDADHVPAPSYLRHVVPIFTNPEIGYVAMPSICGSNKDESYSVRMRLYYEGLMHGALGAGWGVDMMPHCIGSHYAVRTSAIKAIGGIGPELDEDLSTSFMLTSAGYKGAFAIHALAHGEGPSTFEDSMRQEYQWARSAIYLLAHYTTPYFGKLRFREQFRFVMLFLSWLVGKSMVGVSAFVWLMTLVPSSSSSSSASWWQFGVPFGGYVMRQLALVLSWRLLWILMHRAKLLRPVDTPVLAWEAVMHRYCEPWWIMLGIMHGIWGVLTGRQCAFVVTPKGPLGETPLPSRCIRPMALVASLSAFMGLVMGRSDTSTFHHDGATTAIDAATRPHLELASYLAILYSTITVALVLLHYRGRLPPRGERIGLLATMAIPVLLTVGLVAWRASAILVQLESLVVAEMLAVPTFDRALIAILTALVYVTWPARNAK